MKKIHISSTENPIEILYEDSNFLGVLKPAGLIVHATLDKKRENLYDKLKELYPDNYIGLHHRLDMATSGAMLFTKDEKVNAFVQEGFKTHTIEKKYLAIVHGEINVDEKYEDFLSPKKVKQIQIMEKVSKGGLKAISLVKTIKSGKQFSLLEYTLITGRMHQIRVQSRIRNHSIVGDEIYGNLQLDTKINPSRMFLHCKSLSFIFNDSRIEINAPLDHSFKSFIEDIK